MRVARHHIYYRNQGVHLDRNHVHYMCVGMSVPLFALNLSLHNTDASHSYFNAGQIHNLRSVLEVCAACSVSAVCVAATTTTIKIIYFENQLLS